MRGRSTTFTSGSDFAWDNQAGFFGNQGMKRFVGRNDYVNPVVSDPTWGVSDQDMFTRAAELGKLDNGAPFYALLRRCPTTRRMRCPSSCRSLLSRGMARWISI